jgi:hypothetical protein
MGRACACGLSGLLGLVDQAMVNGVESQLKAVGNAELVEDIVQVIFYGLFADEQFFADLFVAVALCDQLHDFFFAVAQQRLSRRGPLSADLVKAFMTSAVI